MTQVTPFGYIRTRLDERFAQLQEDYRSIYGQDIQVNADDIDGQLLGIFAERLSDLDQLGEDIYNSFNPQLATGVALARLVQFNGIRKQAGTFSTVDLTLYGEPNTVVPAGSLVKSTVDNMSWATVTSATIDDSGLVVVGARRPVKDTATASAGSLTKIDTPIFGWHSVANATAAVPGRADETDEELRLRRRFSTNTPAQCILDAVYGAIADLPGVRLARVHENYGNDVDANGQPPHSIYAVVDGGVPADIGRVIWLKKTAGTTTVGDMPVTVQDSQGFDHVVNFSRPAYTDVYVTVELTRHPGYPSDGAQKIKDALVAYGATLDIGVSVDQPRLYTPINSVPNHVITAVKIGTAPGPAGTGTINIPFDGLARFAVERINVVEA